MAGGAATTEERHTEIATKMDMRMVVGWRKCLDEKRKLSYEDSRFCTKRSVPGDANTRLYQLRRVKTSSQNGVDHVAVDIRRRTYEFKEQRSNTTATIIRS